MAMMRRWKTFYLENEITVENRPIHAELYVNGVLQCQHKAFTSYVPLTWQLPTGENITVFLGGILRIHCAIFIDEKLIFSDFSRGIYSKAGHAELMQEKECFVVKKKTVRIVAIGIALLFWLFMCVFIVHFYPYGVEDEWLLYPVLIISLIFGISGLTYLFLWRIVIDKDLIIVRKPFYNRVLNIREITKVDFIEKQDYFILYSGEDKLIKVGSDCESYITLMRRLQNEKIPFYIDGKLIH